MEAININQTKDYVSNHETDKDNPTIFKLGILDSVVDGYLDDLTAVYRFEDGSDNPKFKMNAAERRTRTVQFGLKGIENLKDPKTGEPVKFQTAKKTVCGEVYDIVAPEVMRAIPKIVIYELADEINRLNSFDEAEAKN